MSHRHRCVASSSIVCQRAVPCRLMSKASCPDHARSIKRWWRCYCLQCLRARTESVSLYLWSPQKLRNEVPPKSEGASSDEDDEDDVGTAVSSRASDMRERGVTDVDVLMAGSRDVELRPRKSKKKTTSKRQPPLEGNDDLSERGGISRFPC